MAAAGPPWSVSTPAQAAGLAALEQCPDWPEKARTLLASERPALSDGLAALGLEVVPGQANYLLFRAAGAADLKERMLMRGVLIRSCANYHGLGNDWYRVCVGQAEQNRRLLGRLKGSVVMANAIMIQGTASNAGKSLLAAGLCRIFAQDGYKVAPFKSQNMALNSAITPDGFEMGRAQVVQAEAAGVAPTCG